MDRLSSCYFCGAALDAALEERPVVPSTLHPSTESQKTVVLCGTCQRKLDAVLETVLDAVDAGADDVAPDDRTGGSASASEGSPASDGDLESTLGDDEDILTPIGEGDDADDDAANEGVADAVDAADDDSADDRSKKPKYTKSRGAGFRREDDGPVETGSLTGGAFSDDDDGPDSGSLTGDASADDESTDAGGGGSGRRPASGDQSDGRADRDSSDGGSSNRSGAASGSVSPDDGGSGSAGEDESRRQRDVSMTRLENTKVMRLLENREFPVDREEFVTVAANAYQVSREDCDKVIDLAIEHDLLREENGQLYDGNS